MAFKDTVKSLLGIARPGGVDDVLIRAAKTGVAAFLAQPFVSAVVNGEFSFDAAEAAVVAGVMAAATVVLNAVIAALAKFASS